MVACPKQTDCTILRCRSTNPYPTKPSTACDTAPTPTEKTTLSVVALRSCLSSSCFVEAERGEDEVAPSQGVAKLQGLYLQKAVRLQAAGAKVQLPKVLFPAGSTSSGFRIEESAETGGSDHPTNFRTADMSAAGERGPHTQQTAHVACGSWPC